MKNLTQTELALLVEVEPNTISRYETGRISPSLEIAEKLARELGVSVEILLNGPKEKKISVDLVIATMEKEGDEIMNMRTDGLNVVVNPNSGLMGVAGMAPVKDFGELREMLVDVCKNLVSGFHTLASRGKVANTESNDLDAQTVELMESALDEIKAMQKHDAAEQALPAEKKNFAQRMRDAEGNDKGR